MPPRVATGAVRHIQISKNMGRALIIPLCVKNLIILETRSQSLSSPKNLMIPLHKTGGYVVRVRFNFS